jgi:hypothetical protein
MELMVRIGATSASASAVPESATNDRELEVNERVLEALT